MGYISNQTGREAFTLFRFEVEVSLPPQLKSKRYQLMLRQESLKC